MFYSIFKEVVTKSTEGFTTTSTRGSSQGSTQRASKGKYYFLFFIVKEDCINIETVSSNKSPSKNKIFKYL